MKRGRRTARVRRDSSESEKGDSKKTSALRWWSEGRGVKGVRRCPTFPPVVGSIIGAGRLSFRVRDGTGRFPAAMDRRNSIFHSFGECPHRLGVGGVFFGGGV